MQINKRKQVLGVGLGNMGNACAEAGARQAHVRSAVQRIEFAIQSLSAVSENFIARLEPVLQSANQGVIKDAEELTGVPLADELIALARRIEAMDRIITEASNRCEV